MNWISILFETREQNQIILKCFTCIRKSIQFILRQNATELIKHNYLEVHHNSLILSSIDHQVGNIVHDDGRASLTIGLHSLQVEFIKHDGLQVGELHDQGGGRVAGVAGVRVVVAA